MTVRDEFLARVREALRDRPTPPPVPRDYRRSLDGTDPVELFAERAADYRATVSRVPLDELPRAIGDALRERGVRSLVVPPGLPAAWLAAADVEALTDEPPLDLRALDGSDGVISGCAAAIALTGTIVPFTDIHAPQHLTFFTNAGERDAEIGTALRRHRGRLAPGDRRRGRGCARQRNGAGRHDRRGQVRLLHPVGYLPERLLPTDPRPVGQCRQDRLHRLRVREHRPGEPAVLRADVRRLAGREQPERR